MASSTDNFSSNVAPNKTRYSVEPSCSSSYGPAYLTLESRTGVRESFFPSVSRVGCQAFPILHERAFTPDPFQRISLRAPVQQSICAAKEMHSNALPSVRKYAGTTHSSPVVPFAPSLALNGIQGSTSRSVTRPSAGSFAAGSFLSSKRAVAIGAKFPAVEFPHSAVKNTAADAREQSHASPPGSGAPPPGVIPSSLCLDKLTRHQSNNIVKLPTCKKSNSRKELSPERLYMCSLQDNVGDSVDGHKSELLPRSKETSKSIAVSVVADATAVVRSSNSANGGGNGNRIADKREETELRSAAVPKGHVSLRAAGAPQPKAEMPKTRYTVLVQQSYANGKHLTQTPCSFALPGVVLPKKALQSGCIEGLGPGAVHRPPTYSFYPSSALLSRGCFIASAHSPKGATVFASSPHGTASLCGTRACTTPTLPSLYTNAQLAGMGPLVGQQHPDFLEAPRRLRPCMPGVSRVERVPLFVQGSQWYGCASRPAQASDHAHCSPFLRAADGRASGGIHVEPLIDHSLHLCRKEPKGDNRRLQASQQGQQAHDICRSKHHQSRNVLRSANSTGIEGYTGTASALTFELPTRQRSRSHSAKAFLAYSVPEEHLPAADRMRSRVNAQDNGLKAALIDHEADGQGNARDEAHAKKPCMLRVGQSDNFDRAAPQLLQKPSPGSLSVSSDFVQSMQAAHRSIDGRYAYPQENPSRQSSPGHNLWQSVPGSMRGKQVERFGAALEPTDGSGLRHPSICALTLPLLRKNDCSGVSAASSARTAPRPPPGSSVQEHMQISQGDSHVHHLSAVECACAESSSADVRQYKQLSSNEILWPGRSSRVDAASSTSTAPTTYTSCFPSASSQTTKKNIDICGAGGSNAHPRGDADQIIDTSTCTDGRQSSITHSETSEEHPVIRIGSTQERTPRGDLEFVKSQNSDVTVGSSCSSMAEEHKRFSQLTREAGRLSTKALGGPGTEARRLTTSTNDAMCSTTELPTHVEAHTFGTASVLEAPEGNAQDRMTEGGMKKCEFKEVIGPKQGNCREDVNVRVPWETADWAAPQTSGSHPYSEQSNRQDPEHHHSALLQVQHEEAGLLSSPRKSGPAGMTPRSQTTDNRSLVREIASAYRRMVPGTKHSNALKHDVAGKNSGLPWKSVIVNTKNCRVEKALINTCAERLGWRRQEVDAFKGMWDMTKKRMLYRILSLYGELFPDEYDFFPQCWSLPEDRVRIEQMLHGKNKHVYILKPDGGARGNGVQLVSLYKDIDPMVLRGDGSYIMQKYVENPYLLNRKKFDFRIYCVLFSVSGVPKAYVSKLGMVRFCTEEYQAPSRKNIDNPFMHLTNYSINKDNLYSFVRSTDLHDDSNSKRLLKDVFEELAHDGVDIESVWQQIKAITAKTVVCLQPWLNLRYRHIYRGRSVEPSRCFQLLGLDILLDKNNKCWLLEVNSNPSLRIDYFDSKYDGIDVQLESAVDRHIKEPVVTEALALAYHVLLQHRQPYIQPIPRCCSRSKEHCRVSKLATGCATGTRKQQGHFREFLSRETSRLSRCCSVSDEEEATETEEFAAADKETGCVRGRDREIKRERAASIARLKGGNSAAPVRRAAGCSRAARSADSARTLGETGAAGSSSPAVLKKGGVYAQATAGEREANFKTGNRASSLGKLGSKHCVVAKKGGDHQGVILEGKEILQRDNRPSGATASSRSRQGLQLQQQQPSVLQGKRSVEESMPPFNKKKETPKRSAELTALGQTRSKILAEQNSCPTGRGFSTAFANSPKKNIGMIGTGRLQPVTGARTKTKSRKHTPTCEKLSKQADEENEEDVDVRTSVSPRRAVEEAKLLLERLGPAAAAATPRHCSAVVKVDGGLRDAATRTVSRSYISGFAAGDAGKSFRMKKKKDSEAADPVFAPGSEALHTHLRDADEIKEVEKRTVDVEASEEKTFQSSSHSLVPSKPIPHLHPVSQKLAKEKRQPVATCSSPTSCLNSRSAAPSKANIQKEAEKENFLQHLEQVHPVGETATEADAGRERTEKKATPVLSLAKHGTTPNAACTISCKLGKLICNTRTRLDGTVEHDASGSPHCSSETSASETQSGRSPRTSGAESTLALSSSLVSSCPSSPAARSQKSVSEEATQHDIAADTSTAAEATVTSSGRLSQIAETNRTLEQYRSGGRKKVSKSEDATSGAGWEEDVTTSHAEHASDKGDKTARISTAESGGLRLATEAEQLAVKLEWIEEAYREMERCMDRFNILGLRFASNTSSSTSHQHWSGTSGDSRLQGEGAAPGAASSRRGGGGGAAGSRVSGGKEGKRVGPYKPFLRKDKLANRKGNQTPPKSCYTKLHKDILHPLPPEYLKPQHCWVDLASSIAPLVTKTACVLQVQLLFERIVGFPRLICLQREKLLEVCRVVKLPDVLRKVQVPILSPPSNRSASTRLQAAACPLRHASPFGGSPALRAGGRDVSGYISAALAAANGGGSEPHRSSSEAWAAAGGAADAVGESVPGSSCSNAGALGKGGRSSSRQANNGTGSNRAIQLNRNAGLTSSAAPQQQPQRRQAAGRSSVSRLLVSRGFIRGGIERRRRLGLPDLEALFYAQLQSVRRQLQLQEASFGLGLLETWYLLEPIALICYPFFPTKAKLLEAFVSPLSATWHDRQRTGVQMRLLRSPMHIETFAACKTKPRVELMLQQVEEEDRLAFTDAGGELAASAKGSRSRRCKERVATEEKKKPNHAEAHEKEATPRRSTETEGDLKMSFTPTDHSTLHQDMNCLFENRTICRRPAGDAFPAGRRVLEEEPCTRLTDWHNSAAPSPEEIAAPIVAFKTREGRTTRGGADQPTVASTDTAAHGAQRSWAEDGGRDIAPAKSASAPGRNMREGETSDYTKGNPYGEASFFNGEADRSRGEATKHSFNGEADRSRAEPTNHVHEALQERCILSDVGSPETLSADTCESAGQTSSIVQPSEGSFLHPASSKLQDLHPNNPCDFKRADLASGPPSAHMVGHAHPRMQISSVPPCHCQPVERRSDFNDDAPLPPGPPLAADGRYTAQYLKADTPVNECRKLQEEATQQPLLFLWGREQQEQQQQHSFADERDVSTASTLRSAPMQCCHHRISQLTVCARQVAPVSAFADASSGVKWYTTGAAENDAGVPGNNAGTPVEKEHEEEQPKLLLPDTPAHKEGEPARGDSRIAATPRALPVSLPTGDGDNSSDDLNGNRREITADGKRGSMQEGGCNVEVYDAENLSQAEASHSVTAAESAVAGGFELPEWHAGLCAAWPEELCSYIRKSVPTEDRLEAMKRLVDYFHLRLDYCSFCALVPGAGTTGGRL